MQRNHYTLKAESVWWSTFANNQDVMWVSKFTNLIHFKSKYWKIRGCKHSRWLQSLDGGFVGSSLVDYQTFLLLKHRSTTSSPFLLTIVIGMYLKTTRPKTGGVFGRKTPFETANLSFKDKTTPYRELVWVVFTGWFWRKPPENPKTARL